MNQRLLNAVNSLQNVLDNQKGESIEQLTATLLGTGDFGEAEIPAALWTLISEGLAEIRDGKVYLSEAAAV